jgi:hypothetical protein
MVEVEMSDGCSQLITSRSVAHKEEEEGSGVSLVTELEALGVQNHKNVSVRS